jgi:hypothetical protein
MSGDYRVYTFCPEHGINCKIDDDGTCSSCGATAVGQALNEIEKLLLQRIESDGGFDEQKREAERLRAELVDAKKDHARLRHTLATSKARSDRLTAENDSLQARAGAMVIFYKKRAPGLQAEFALISGPGVADEAS